MTVRSEIGALRRETSDRDQSNHIDLSKSTMLFWYLG